jgi:DNA-binding IclR family transcriptional regulator
VSGRRRSGTPRTVTARVMSILSAFSKEHPILGLAEISRRTGLSSSTTHRLAAELTDWGALARTSDLRYRIGPTLHRLGEISPRYCQPADFHRKSRTGKSGVVDND